MWVIILHNRIFVFVLVLFFVIPTTCYAQTESISASKSVVMDMSSEMLLYDKSANEKASMASTTKIMTCLIALEKADLKKTVTITSSMLNGTEGSLIYLKAGDRITVLDLVKGAMLASGNDAANALALTVCDSINDFANLMNSYAKKFGMNNTNFVTPSGLDNKKHYSTAYDMALLTKQALLNKEFRSICSKSSDVIVINGNKQKIYNHNKLLYQVDECIGVKTGFTSKSGRCLVSAYNYNENIIIIITLNASDDWNDHKKLLDYAKKKYKTIKDSYYVNIDCVGSDLELVKCIARYDISYIGDLSFKAYYYPFIYAPVLKNAVVGKLEIYSNKNLLKTVDITVLESVTVWQITK